MASRQNSRHRMSLRNWGDNNQSRISFLWRQQAWWHGDKKGTHKDRRRVGVHPQSQRQHEGWAQCWWERKARPPYRRPLSRRSSWPRSLTDAATAPADLNHGPPSCALAERGAQPHRNPPMLFPFAPLPKQTTRTQKENQTSDSRLDAAPPQNADAAVLHAAAELRGGWTGRREMWRRRGDDSDLFPTPARGDKNRELLR